MAARGSVAKEVVIEKIKAAFGEDFAGIDEKKKLYVWANDGGEKVQIAIALTCPKANVDFGTAPTLPAVNNALNFDEEDTPQPQGYSAPQMGEDEKATLDRLMKELGL